MSSFQPEECPIDAIIHNKCSCEHCQQQALEKEFKASINAFYAAERLPVSKEISSACHRSEKALMVFLQKTMTEEASMRYVSLISAKVDEQYNESTRSKVLEYTRRVYERSIERPTLEAEYEEALKALYYMTYLLYPKTTAENISRPGIQKHYNACRACEEALLNCLRKTISEQEAQEYVARISDKVYAEESELNRKKA
jgi:hypothetical protein